MSSKFYFVDTMKLTGFGIFYLSVFGSVILSAPSFFVNAHDAHVLVSSGRMIGLVLASSIAYAVNSFAAFSVMSRVIPPTYSIFNIEKRLFVVLASWVAIGQWPTLLTIAGLALSTMGLYLYLM